MWGYVWLPWLHIRLNISSEEILLARSPGLFLLEHLEVLNFTGRLPWLVLVELIKGNAGLYFGTVTRFHLFASDRLVSSWGLVIAGYH